MVASKEDLTLPGLNIESSLMWRSKPTPLRLWLKKWRTGVIPPAPIYTNLKTLQWSRFEAELTSLLPVIHVSPFQRRENVQEKKTPDTSGPTSLTSLEQLDLFGASLKTSKDTSALDCERSLQIWKKLVIQRRGEYSARLKLAYAKNIQKVSTREKESSLWLTPMVQDSKHSGTNPGPNGERKLLVNQVNWPTATVFYVTTGSYPTELGERPVEIEAQQRPQQPLVRSKIKGCSGNSRENELTPTAHEARLGYQARSDPGSKRERRNFTDDRCGESRRGEIENALAI